MQPDMLHAFTPISDPPPEAILVVAKDFSLKGFSEIPKNYSKATWQLILSDSTTDKWAILRTDREHKFLNTLQGPHWAKQCLSWLQSGHVTVNFAPLRHGREFILCQHADQVSGRYVPGLLSAEGVGAIPHSGLFEEAEAMSPEQAALQHTRFSSVWQHAEQLKTSDKLQQQLEFLAAPHPAEWVYMRACQIFVPDTEVQHDYLDTPPGYTDTAIWKALFNFQQDGVKGVINKMLKYNGCILADSVGLGKTYEALAVIKYFARKGDKVLVLAPKRLRDNWALFTLNDDRNPFADDPFHYDLLNHTDLNRQSGKSGDIDLSHFRWEHFDLIVIDESHNFRNKGSRYRHLLEQVINRGAKTKILLLTATPVNNRVTDLRNQINLIAGGNDKHLEPHGIESINETARQAQKKFAEWAKTPENERVQISLLHVLGQDYIHLLDLLTIARSRKHIVAHYNSDATVNMFPRRLPPINLYPQSGDNGFLPVQAISETLQKLHMAIYRPLYYVLEPRKEHYLKQYNQQIGANLVFSQIDREKSLSALMTVNLLKRMESSVEAYAITLGKQIENTTAQLAMLQNEQQVVWDNDISEEDIDDEDDALLGSAKIKVALQDLDRHRLKHDLQEDLNYLQQLQQHIDVVRKTQDSKLKQLREIISRKITAPLNPGNKKVIIFTAFADTATYLFEKLSPWLLQEYGLHTAMVSGAKRNRCTLDGVRTDQDSLLSAFSPRSKKFDLARTAGRQIDVLIATDCVSEGQNLQDCDFLIHADIHWNPVRIIQRFGRIDRIGSTNSVIQMVNMWPMAELNEYINLEQRVKAKMGLLSSSATGADNLLSREEKQDLDFRFRQLEKLKDEVINLEDVAADASITNLNFQQHRSDLQNFCLAPQAHRPEKWPSYLGAVSASTAGVPAGAFFLLKSYAKIKADKTYPYAPYYLLHVAEGGSVLPQFRNIRDMLDLLQTAVRAAHGQQEACQTRFDKSTKNGADMAHYTKLLSAAVRELMGEEKASIGRSAFAAGKPLLGRGRTARGVDDVEVITWLAVLP